VTRPLLDGDLVRTRRKALGLSPEALGAAVGLSGQTVRRLEDGSGGQRLELGRTTRLAERLGLHLTTLLVVDGSGRPEPVPPGPDDVVLEAALRQAGRPLSRPELAMALGWDMTRTHEAFRALAARLRGTGQRLRQVGGNHRWAICAADELLSAKQRRGLVRAVAGAWALRRDDCQLLRRVVVEGVDKQDWDQRRSNNDRVRMARLENLGLVQVRGGRYVPTPEVAYTMKCASAAEFREPAGPTSETERPR
jgi:transcriptional regulator with XRE-family HTH domain